MTRASIKDVARLASVSVATVSRTLNAPRTVSNETAVRVREAAKMLGFRPNHVGRNLRSGHTRTLGLVVPTLANAVFAECVQGMEEAARRLDYALIVTASEYHPEEESAACERLLRHRVDGLVLTVADAASSPVLDRLERENIPYALVYNPVSARRGITVTVDNRGAARDGVRYLVDLGHRAIRMLTGRLAVSDRAVQRLLGYADAMREGGLQPRHAIEVPFQTDGNIDILREILESDDPPTALFCSNDLLAIRTMRDLRRLGRRVPRDLSILGFDGIATGLFVEPSLTTVVQPSHEIGARALEALVARLEGNPAPVGLELPHHVRAGESTRALSARPPKETR